MNLVRDDLHGFVKPPRTPVRVVLNNSTISFFMSDNFGDINFSSTLKDVGVDRGTDDKYCLKITNKRNGEFRRVCAMEYSKDT